MRHGRPQAHRPLFSTQHHLICSRSSLCTWDALCRHMGAAAREARQAAGPPSFVFGATAASDCDRDARHRCPGYCCCFVDLVLVLPLVGVLPTTSSVVFAMHFDARGRRCPAWERRTILHLASSARQFARSMIAKMSILRAIPMPCLLYTSPSPRDRQKSRMPSSA